MIAYYTMSALYNAADICRYISRNKGHLGSSRRIMKALVVGARDSIKDTK